MGIERKRMIVWIGEKGRVGGEMGDVVGGKKGKEG